MNECLDPNGYESQDATRQVIVAIFEVRAGVEKKKQLINGYGWIERRFPFSTPLKLG